MTFPKHKNPSKGNEATAPYNFVPLPDKVEAVSLNNLPDHDSYDTARHTGRIEVKLTTASPLYIRGGLSPELFAEIGKKSFHELNDAQKREVAKFFHSHTNPVIPGSSLRGMLRSMVEIVSYGKVQPVSDKEMVYRAIGGKTTFADKYRERLMQEDAPLTFTPLLKAGYIEKRGLAWFIRPAKDINGVTFSRILINNVPRNLPRWHNIKNAHKIWFTPGPYTYKNVKGGFIKMKFSDALEPSAVEQPGLQAGVHIYSGRMNSKKFDRVIYPPDKTVDAIPIPDEMVMAYREQISKEQTKLLGKDGVLQDKHPVFYLMENDDLVFFGHTMMLRIPYPNAPQDFVPQILRQETQIDFTEAMFGYVRGREVKTNIPKEKAYAGRIFVGEARLAQEANDIWLDNSPITPKILSGPKPTSFQLYLTQQKPDPHIYKTKKGATKSEMHLSHYASQTPDETVIRGHKLYWHKGPNPAIKNDNPNASATQLTQISPLKPGVSFTFTIHFENLSELELGALLWVLNLGADPNYRLKLGMSKPLGMGAIETKPTLRLTNRRARYSSLFNGNNWQLGYSEDSGVVAEKAPKTFESFIRDNHSDAFGGDGRIEQLLALLSWPGPDPKDTAYIDDLNEFRKRKVLPTPKHIHPFRPTYEYKVEYDKNYVFEAKIEGKWDGKIKGLEITMPNGEIGHLSIPSRKRIAKEHGNTVELVVADFKNGIYILDFH